MADEGTLDGAAPTPEDGESPTQLRTGWNPNDADKKADHWETFQFLALLGPATFLQRLIPIEKVESEYRRFNENNSRNFMLLRLLIEVQRAGAAMERWRQCVATTPEAAPGATNGYERLSFESMIDEQSLWQRKLSEGLVLLINFSLSNDPAFYYHFFLIRELRRYDSDLKEQQRFFAETSKAIERRKERILSRIVAIEKQLNDTPWYMKRAAGDRREVTSFSDQLERALRLASQGERQALCYTYAKGYGERSDNIHFNPVRPEYFDLAQRFLLGFAILGILTVTILNRAHLLANVVPEGINRRLASQIATPSKRNIAVGDFVFAYGPSLAVVKEIRAGKHGYCSYRIKYLADCPEADTAEDWVAEFDVTAFLSGAEMLSALRRYLGGFESEAMRNMGQTAPDAELAESLCSGIREMWDLGFGAYIKLNAKPFRVATTHD